MCETWLHRRHPFVKLMGMVLMVVAVFACSSAGAALGLLLILLILLISAGFPPWRMRGRWLLCALALSAVLIHFLLGGRSGDALDAGMKGAARLLVLVLAGRLFALTTDPGDFGQMLIGLGLPYRWAYALMMALRLEPLFAQQARLVYWAQLSRGVRYDQGPLWQRASQFRRLLVPLLVSALRSARDLAGSMEHRGFGRYRKRTCMNPLCWDRGDSLVLAGWLMLCLPVVLWL